jgi:transposase
MWTNAGTYKVNSHQTVKGLFDLVAAKNIHNGNFHYKYYDFKNSFIITDMLQYLLDVYPNKHLYIILDNWSAHRSAVTKTFVDLNSRINLVYLPFSTSWLNDIERNFSLIERCVLRNSNLSSVREAMNAITDFIENYPSFNRKAN